MLNPASLPRYAGRLRALALRLAVLTALSAGTARADTPGTTLPVTPATTAGSEGGGARDPAALIAALQKQIAAQQAQLQALEKDLLASSVTPAASGAVPTQKADEKGPSVGLSHDAGTPVSGDAAASAAPATQTPSTAPVREEPTAAPVATPSAPVRTAPAATTPQASAASSAPVPENAQPQTEAERQAYASGVSVWRDIENSLSAQRALGFSLDRRWVMAGLQDMSAGRNLRMSQDTMGVVMSTLNEQYATRLRDEREHQEAEGKALRIAFSKEKGTRSDAGAWYKVLDSGRGRHLRTSDVIEFSVTGTLPDGSVFDASGQSGQTKTARVGALLPAVAIGLQKIGVGGQIKIVVPPAKGYGDNGLPPAIPGGATLIFDITVKGLKGTS
ncbi:FKBP-type peptidyl-prolyl cis-trans isomerase [Klebsiella aerogenes]|uniref:FKBP-type peptidyl-prolyl cis-trans isomerase n=1 Tax=Klebsiella aerogenes TaxID=548 RepID=UPI002FF64F40